MTVYPITDGALDREGDKAIDADVSLFTIGISLLTVAYPTPTPYPNP